VVKLHEEFFLPGEVILEQGTVVDQIYIVAHGCLVLFVNKTFTPIILLSFFKKKKYMNYEKTELSFITA